MKSILGYKLFDKYIQYWGGTWPDLRISQGSLYNLVLLSVKLGEAGTKKQRKKNDWAGHRPICISESKGFAVVNVVS